jgi:hypothetical protein
MLRTALVASTLAVSAMSIALPAAAQSLCGERRQFVDHLAKKHQEQPTSIGLASNGSMVEVLTSETGTWTIIVTQPNGTACVVAAGEAWESRPPSPLAMKPSA